MVQTQQLQNLPIDVSNNHLLKSEEPGLEGLRKIVMNRWVPRTMEYYEEKFEFQREREAFDEKEEIIEETKTKKIFYKLEEKY